MTMMTTASMARDERCGTAAVADFGISAKLESTMGHLMPSSLRGSVNYAAPEQNDPEV